MRIVRLSVEEERELARRWRDHADEAALARLAESQLGLARSIARRFGADEDGVQEAQLGVLLAARRFNPDLGYRFSTYASHWIRSCIARYQARAQHAEIPVEDVEDVAEPAQEDDLFTRTIRRLKVETALGRLAPRLQSVINGRLSGVPHEVIGQHLGVTRERVYQLEALAVRELRALIADDAP
jgi:RNA polymerase sigma factor (sigma-70 family)